MPTPENTPHADWSIDSWRSRLASHQVIYPDRQAVDAAVERLRRLPPLVTSWEIERLRSLIADAQAGKRFLLQGGDCAERMADCTPQRITGTLKVLLQMSLVMIHGSRRPVIPVGRFAGQYAKPRSSPIETRSIDGNPVTLPSYHGDLVNAEAFDHDSRAPNPARMVDGYMHAAMTLNFIRSLLDAGFADFHHPEYWDLGFLKNAALPEHLRTEYQNMTRQLGDSLRFMEALSDRAIHEISRVEFFTSHEALNLLYESAHTRTVPRRTGHYNLTTHLPWIGERTRAIDGAHVEYCRGIQNPVGIKLGPATTPDDLRSLLRTLNPHNTPGRIVLVARMGVTNIQRTLPPLVRSTIHNADAVLWVVDPMHGNTRSTSTGIKTRLFTDILDETSLACDIMHDLGSTLGGIHLELTGEDITECLGGASNLTEADLQRNYDSPCDPRLNYEQSIEIAFLLARKLHQPAP